MGTPKTGDELPVFSFLIRRRSQNLACPTRDVLIGLQVLQRTVHLPLSEPLQEMQKKKDSECIARKSALQNEVFKDQVAEWSPRFIGDIAYGYEIREEYEPEEIECCVDGVANVRRNPGDFCRRQLNRSSI
jgi:hypothetical protein